MIGASYTYYNSDETFVLGFIQWGIYYFECGHWCTDSVFEDFHQVTLF